jgi:integrase
MGGPIANDALPQTDEACFGCGSDRQFSDPAAALKGAITRLKTKHRKPLTRAGLPRFVKALDSYGGYRTTVIALRLMLLTFVRTVELRAAHWAEIDLDRAEWRIRRANEDARAAYRSPVAAGRRTSTGAAESHRWA